MQKRGMIFDMDGTLWDSVEQIVISWNQTLEQMGEMHVHVSRERLTGLMGQTMDAFARELFREEPPETAMQKLHILEIAENDYLRTHGAVLLGDVRKVFEELRSGGYGIYIVSNCQSGYIEAFLDHYQIWDLVDDLACFGDTKCGKAENLQALIRKHGLTHYWYLGDTRGDQEACEQARVPFLFASYGFGEVQGEVLTLQRLEDLPDLLGRIDVHS